VCVNEYRTWFLYHLMCDSWSPLHHAAHRGHLDVCKWLVLERKVLVELPGGNDNETPRGLAWSRGNTEVEKFLESRGR